MLVGARILIVYAIKLALNLIKLLFPELNIYLLVGRRVLTTVVKRYQEQMD